MKNIVGDKLHLVVESITEIAENIKRVTFVDKDGDDLPVYAGGAHVVVEMQDGNILRRNPYSLMGDLDDRKFYSISVLRLENGRGGSKFIHDQLKKGMEITVSYPVNLFGLDLRAHKHLLIAGGIGITPIISHADALSKRVLPFDLHYIVRSHARAAYADMLQTKYGHRFHLHISNEISPDFTRDDLTNLLSNQPIGTHAYVCGPEGLIRSVVEIGEELGWDKNALHYEEFLAPKPGKPFSVELRASGKTITVGEHQSILEAIESAGVDPPYLCRGGACGQCETDVISHSGDIIHRDHFLSDEEKHSGKKIMPCVSRLEGSDAHIVLER